MSVPYRAYPPEARGEFQSSRFGYIIERDGTIIALDELQTHGKIVYERHKEVRDHYDAPHRREGQNERKTAAELYSTEYMGFIRISIAPYVYSWNFGSSRSVLPNDRQTRALDFLMDVSGMSEDEVWHDRGEAPWPIVRQWITSKNWGV